jgi:hypothetical protein
MDLSSIGAGDIGFRTSEERQALGDTWNTRICSYYSRDLTGFGTRYSYNGMGIIRLDMWQRRQGIEGMASMMRTLLQWSVRSRIRCIIADI